MATSSSEDARAARDVGRGDIKTDGSLEFVHEFAGNDSTPSYQEVSGAPVENISPLGTQVGWLTTIFLNIGQMIGTGVFSTPGSILKGVGSVGLSMIFWAIGLLIAGSQLAVYTELASFFPNRSGAEVVYLEQAYPRPKYFLPTAFAVQSVILSFSSSNAIVVIFSTKWSLRLSNAIGIIKIITLIFISITGLVVLGGHTRIKDPHANFRDSFSGTTGSGYGLANALVKINFAYFGFTNAFNVVAEVKRPIQTLKKTAPASLLVVAILYILCNIAYFAAVPKESIASSKQLVASLFFTAVFGNKHASKALNFLIALSAFGNIISVVIGSSRIIRECGRQGVLPWPRVWGSTRPFGTPLAAYGLKWGLTVLMIVAPPAGDAFNFIVDLQSYPSNVFTFLTTFGLFLIRRSRARIGIERAEFRTWNVAIIFSLAVNIFILIMPWFPPPSGRYGGDVSFWYATYCAVGLGILAVCAIYYAFWIYIIPHFGKYQIRQELVQLDDGSAKVHRLVKIPLAELETWDAEHDVLGQKLRDLVGSGSEDAERVQTSKKEA
ncbi:High-affinity methionine permease [Lachnellula cervina]|uniref:High-affinity methionine permease n=1 Tax=Lachnellula cervina TaxID=1316786 RepID=A0A7D8US58_9HELO|nr:High-affinity methionine permease [Lachnellula cervina]